MRRHLVQPAATVAMALSLAGCMKSRPKYKAPVSAPLAQAEKWNTPLAGGATAKPAEDETLASWWATLNDPLLTALEERALKANLDVRKAEAKIRQARALRYAAQTERQPTVTARGSAAGSRTGNQDGPAQVSQMYSAGIDASWEPDFYGRIRQTIEAYDADLGAAEESLRDVLVSLTAELALSYVDARSYQSQLAITRANLAKQEETLRLTQTRYETGLATELEVQQSRLTVESTKAGIPSLEANYQKSVNRIAVLLGEKPGAVDAELAAVKPVPVVPAEIAVGVPADLVRRRPDIRSAERQVAAQYARVGVATADLYPSFSLSGSIGLDALSIGDLFSPGALLMSAKGALQQTIFNRRRIRENINAQDALLDQQVTAYESTVLTALEDVETALIAFGQEQVRRKSLAEAAAAGELEVTVSTDLYTAGLKDFLDVLDAQRSLLTLQNQLAQSDAAITADLIRLYKALGGGWGSTAGAKKQAARG
jgi:NodT family efflux transporter outer membrane factor (OMF) lipoprotein